MHYQRDYALGVLNETVLDRLRGWAHALLRIIAGLLFTQHGLQKLFGLLGGQRVTDLTSQFGLAGVLELVGGLLVVLGFLTRPVALVLGAQMLVAYALMHAPQGGSPIENKGELALLFAAVFFFLAASGAGPLSVDAARGASRRRRDRLHSLR